MRLRRLTGNKKLMSQGELDGQHMTLGDVAMMTLVRPFILGFREPIVACWNVYIALVYGQYPSRAQSAIAYQVCRHSLLLHCIVRCRLHRKSPLQSRSKRPCFHGAYSPLEHAYCCFLSRILQGIIVGVLLCYLGFLPWLIISLKPRFKPGGCKCLHIGVFELRLLLCSICT